MTGRLKIVKTDEEIAHAWYQAAVRVAIIAMLFSIIGGVMLGQASVIKNANNPFNNPQLKAWDTQLNQLNSNREKNKDEIDALVKKIQDKDLKLNQEFFKANAFIRYGEYMLVGGLAFFILGAQLALKYRKKLPEPQRKSIDTVWIAAGISRRTTIMVGVLLIGGMVVIVAKSPGDPFAALAKIVVDGGTKISHSLGVASSATATAATPMPDDSSTNTSTVTVTVTNTVTVSVPVPGLPSSQSNGDAMRNWPAFRGPLGTGVTFGARPPYKWDSETNENILWKMPVALPGMSSPIVWEDKVYITGATEDKREVYCYNGTTGELIWTKEISAGANEPTEKPSVFDDTGFAAPTMATDGNWLYAMFANGDVAGIDLKNEKPPWVVNNWGIPVSIYGYSSSLLPYRNRLIVQLDQTLTDKAENPITRRISCLDGTSGVEIWHTDRPEDSGDTWSSPILINTGSQEMIVTAGRPFAIAYDPIDGKELWRVECLGGDVGPSPIYAGGLIFVAEESEKLTALRPDGTIVWQAEDDLPNTVSPLSNGDLIFVTSGEGKISCYDVATGKQYWQHTFGTAGAYASPVLVGNSVFFTDRKGTTYIFPAERTFNKDTLVTNVINDNIDASMAVVGDRIYIRGEKTLYCIANKAAGQ